MNTKALQRGFWLSFWSVVTIMTVRGALIPARLRNPRITSLSGIGPVYAMLSWGYSAGGRPVNVIFDLQFTGGATGSVTVDGEALEAEVPLIGIAHIGEAYTITATLVYRWLGWTFTRQMQVSGQVG
ncbi:MAG: hypothetical protein C0184_15725 [Chloroflexus aggregans]|uniref:Uncharacterized protein n=1 Tax=Chloroflexus aggregans TaxID=152260 RepID=A0A2J6WT62_9CHLR|nr:MAG: hypothetical protein C0184_15725 [Chloroflexus aggregans]